jgi:hypothetical protein
MDGSFVLTRHLTVLAALTVDFKAAVDTTSNLKADIRVVVVVATAAAVVDTTVEEDMVITTMATEAALAPAAEATAGVLVLAEVLVLALALVVVDMAAAMVCRI